MGRGRPAKSEIREKITALIERLGFSYGYEIYKYYRELFNDATSRVIYYHLKKGTEMGEFVTVNVKRVLGNYSWGDETERVYYALGPFARTKPRWSSKVKDLDLRSRDLDITYDWQEEINKKIVGLKAEAKKVKGKSKKKLINKCNKLLEWAKHKLDDSGKIESEIKSIKLFLK